MKNPTPPTGTSRFNRARVTGRFNAAEDLAATQKALVKSGASWATRAKLADLLDMSPQAFDALCGDGDPAVTCGDVEALGARFALPFYRRRIARLEADATTHLSMRDAAELAVEGAATLQRTVRLADADGKHEEHELDDIDRELAAAEAHLAAVRALSMQMRAKVRAQREASR